MTGQSAFAMTFSSPQRRRVVPIGLRGGTPQARRCTAGKILIGTDEQMSELNQHESDAASPGMRAAAFGVHIFTAVGAGIALIAMLEAVREHWAAMFAWLGLALVIDAIDGPIARRLNVINVHPDWSGEVLDLVVDFVTYVFVPAYAITASGLLLPLAAPLLGIGVVVSGPRDFRANSRTAGDNNYS